MSEHNDALMGQTTRATGDEALKALVLLERLGVITTDPAKAEECCGIQRDEDGRCWHRPRHPIYVRVAASGTRPRTRPANMADLMRERGSRDHADHVSTEALDVAELYQQVRERLDDPWNVQMRCYGCHESFALCVASGDEWASRCCTRCDHGGLSRAYFVLGQVLDFHKPADLDGNDERLSVICCKACSSLPSGDSFTPHEYIEVEWPCPTARIVLNLGSWSGKDATS